MDQFGVFSVFLSLGIVVALILWILLPFAVFGIKPRLDKINHEQYLTTKALESFLESQEKTRASIDQLNALLAQAIRRPTPPPPPAPKPPIA
jgi:predicted RND superfamily exporter protein